MHPGVVDKNIEATEGLDGLQNSFFRCTGVSHVGPHAHRLSPAGTNLFDAFTRVQEICNHHAHAPGSQCRGNATVAASRASGYSCYIYDFGSCMSHRLQPPLRRTGSRSFALLASHFCETLAGILRPFRMVFVGAPEIWKELIDSKVVVKCFEKLDLFY